MSAEKTSGEAASASLMARCSRNPLAQGAIVGSLTLIPARKWPGWLRMSFLWGPAALGAAVIVVPGAATSAFKLAGVDITRAQEIPAEPAADTPETLTSTTAAPADTSDASEFSSLPGESPTQEIPAVTDHADHSSAAQSVSGEEPAPSKSPAMQAAARVVLGAGVAGMLYGVSRFSLWADEAAERALRRLKVPAPRVVLAGAVGTAQAVATAAENRRTEQSS